MNATETAPEKAEATAAPTPRILIVDDEKAMQMLAGAIVEKLGFDYTCVDSGEDAAAVTREAFDSGNRYSVVVMDLALPGGMSGLEATLAIKQVDPDAQVIVSSGYLEQNARTAALEHGFAGILPKPYTADRLASELRWVVKRSTAALSQG